MEKNKNIQVSKHVCSMNIQCATTTAMSSTYLFYIIRGEFKCKDENS